MIITDVQLRFQDMDMLGHMNNGQYTHVFDIGKLDFLQRVLDIDWRQNGDGVVNVTTTNTYYIQVKFGDTVEIQTTAEKIGGKSFTLLHKMIDKKTGEVKADSRVVLVAFNFKEQKSIDIPAAWRENIEKEIAKRD